MKRLKDEFRRYDEKYVQQKKEQYEDVAIKVRELIQKSGYVEDEGGFSLAKKWLLCNERGSIRKAFSDAGRVMINDVSKWVPIGISFVLGVLASFFTSREGVAITEIPWLLFFFIIILGFCMEIGLKYGSERIEKFHIRILEEMTFLEYMTLVQGGVEKDTSEKSKSIEDKGQIDILYNEIEKNLNKKKKQTFNRYKDSLAYLGCFTTEQLDYIQVTAKTKVELYKRLCDMSGIISMLISIVALFCSFVPKDVISRAGLLKDVAIAICIFAVVYSFVYLGGECSMSRTAARHEHVLMLVDKVKEKR